MSDRVLSLDNLQEFSEAIRAASKPSEIETLLNQILEFYGVINFQYRYDSALWRGVRCDSDRGHKTIYRVMQPPPQLTKNGRLNEIGRPILYASVSQFAVLEEIGAQAGDFIQVVAYSFKPSARLKCCIVGEIT